MSFTPIYTERLALRPLQLIDAPHIQKLVGDWEVARTLARAPHPYKDGMAEDWIGSVADNFETGGSFTFAIERRHDGAFIGAVGLERKQDTTYVLGYWLGRRYWGQGYMYEATARLVRFGFDERGIERIVASAMPTNVASVAVLTKLGMTVKGRDMMEFPARGERRDVVRFRLDRDAYEQARSD